MEFVPLPKIARLNRECTITEKIDGTNAQITIVSPHVTEIYQATELEVANVDGFAILAGSRSRWLQPTKSNDNFGFAGWVRDNAQDLVKLGEGSHFGEWWGSGIQRGYDLPKGEKRFSLFNTARWSDESIRPKCCYVVPLLYEGLFSTRIIEAAESGLRQNGSAAAPGFMKPEGIIVFHHAQRSLFKVTLERDQEPKGAERAA